MKTYGGVMEVSGEPSAPAALPPGKEPTVSLDRRLSGPQSCSVHDSAFV
jgi:hypothetical protein